MCQGDDAQIELDRRIGRVDDECALEPALRFAQQLARQRELTPGDRRRNGVRPAVSQRGLIAGPEELVHGEARQPVGQIDRALQQPHIPGTELQV